MNSKKVLVIDDTPDFRLLMHQALKPKGIEVLAYDCGHKALKFLEDAGELPHLAFVDLRMPGMRGEEFLSKVRGSDRTRKLRVILTSGWSNLASIARKTGADGFLKKPFDLDDLYRIVDSL